MGQFQYGVIAAAIAQVLAGTTDLDQLAQVAGYEATHFQKMFTDHVGISPKRMGQYLAYRRAREFLLDGYATLDAAYAAGLSGGGRIHDLFVSCEAATPGEVKARGAGLSILYAYHATPLGEILIAQTPRGLCWLGFITEGRRAAFSKLRMHWPLADLTEDVAATNETAAHVMDIWRGHGAMSRRLRLDLHGTNFQIQVWRALLRIPSGGTVTYRHVAEKMDDVNACRAVGTAIGRNPIAVLIPCHRVIQGSGIVENYAWGTARKKMLLGIEAERHRAGEDQRPSTSRMV